MAKANASERYRLSFTVGGLYLQEGPIAARVFLELRDWEAVRATLDAENLLQARTASSAKRLSREVVQRLERLTDSELTILSDTTADERAQLMWVATCRRYEFIAEFAEEVIHERFLLMAPDLTTEHFDAFVRGKMIWHPELAELEVSTLRKLRATLFLMMRQADLVTNEGHIVTSVLSERIRQELEKRDPSDVRLFAARDVG